MPVLKKRKENGEFDVVLDFDIVEKSTNKLELIPEDDGTHLYSSVKYPSVKAVVAHVAKEIRKLSAVTRKDEYIQNANEYTTTGYIKTSKDYTANLPQEVSGTDSEWGVLFFVAENAIELTGTQMFYPIDGPYKGRIFTRSLTCMSYNPRIGDWLILATGNDIDELSEDISSLSLAMDSKIDGAYVTDDGYLMLTSDGVPVTDPIGPFAGNAGGSSSGGNSATITASNTSGWLFKTVSETETCAISINWASVEDGLQTGAGTLQISVNGTVKLNKSVQQGDVSVDVSDIISKGTNKVYATIYDVYGNSRLIKFTIDVVALTLTSSFNDTLAYNGAISFYYTPTCSTTLTMQFKLDGTLIGSASVSSSGRQRTFTIPAQEHGTHTFEAYFTSEINGENVESNHLYYDIICTEEDDDTCVIASSFNAVGASQYYQISIPYIVYTPNSLTSDVVLSANGEVIQNLSNVDRTKHIWSYIPEETGTLTLSITSGDVTKSFTLNVVETDIDVSAETDSLELYLTAYGRSNSEEDPSSWSFEDENDNSIDAVLSNFNYASDGWQLDEDNVSVLRVSGDARVNIPLQIFKDDFRSTGKTIELEFATSSILNYDTTIISCMNGNVGLNITAKEAVLKSAQTTISTQYKEDEHVRISFVVEKRSENRLAYIYINGILSGVTQYPATDDFSQASPVGITIGSNDCTLDLYCIRVYNNNLTRYQILDNWIADTADGNTMLARYEDNDIFDSYNNIVIDKLPSKLPYMVIQATKLPQYKGDKQTVSGYYVDPSNDLKSFTFTNASCDVQGTSSQYYARKNYKIKFKNFTDNGDVTSTTYALRDGAIPVNTFTFKADVASSEGCNNVELVRLYNDICPYQTPPQEDNSAVRQGIDGFPIVVFWANDDGDVSFLGKYNFNNDKGTAETFGFAEGDESWEILSNTSDLVLFKSADFESTSVDDNGETYFDWTNSFEGRYPDGSEEITRLKAMVAWVASTDQTAATNAALSESKTYGGVTYTNDTSAYRLAKFKAEFEDWFDLDDSVFYYIFTEAFLMVDSRAKNAFPTRFNEEGKWCWLPYDMDTAIGINNEGILAFDYNLEDTDTVGGANVYNGQNSVLWNNLRQAFASEISSMYTTLRSRSDGKFSYDYVESAFENHQSYWSAAIFNEDAYFKYIKPLTAPENGDAATSTYLEMCQGSKAEQRKWWLYNRFRYLDSKYTAGDASQSTITIRAYQKSNFAITPYADIYACAKFDNAFVKSRASRGVTTNIVSPTAWNPGGSDSVVTIYSADQLSDVGDLSPFYVGYNDFASATKLKRLKLGDSASTYSNPNLTTVSLGTNTLLRTLDVRNCPNLTSVDISGCTNVEYVYCDGTGLTGIELPNGGILKTLHLPETIVNLTVLNQTKLTNFELESYSQITTLRVENTPLIGDLVLDMLDAMSAGSRVRVIGFTWEKTDGENNRAFVNKLLTFRGVDEAGNNTVKPQLKGTIHFDTITPKQIALITDNFSDITITYDELGEDKVALHEYWAHNYPSNGVLYNENLTAVNSFAFNSHKVEVIILPNVTVLRNDAFYYINSHLKYAYFEKLERIQSSGLRQVYDTNCALVINNSETVVNLEAQNGLLYSGSTINGYLYVPRSMVSSYQTATNWSVVANGKIRAIEDYPEVLNYESYMGV